MNTHDTELVTAQALLITLHSDASKIVLRILKIGFLQISGVAGCAADVRLALHARAGRDR